MDRRTGKNGASHHTTRETPTATMPERPNRRENYGTAYRPASKLKLTVTELNLWPDGREKMGRATTPPQKHPLPRCLKDRIRERIMALRNGRHQVTAIEWNPRTTGRERMELTTAPPQPIIMTRERRGQKDNHIKKDMLRDLRLLLQN